MNMNIYSFFIYIFIYNCSPKYTEKPFVSFFAKQKICQKQMLQIEAVVILSFTPSENAKRLNINGGKKT